MSSETIHWEGMERLSKNTEKIKTGQPGMLYPAVIIQIQRRNSLSQTKAKRVHQH